MLVSPLQSFNASGELLSIGARKLDPSVQRAIEELRIRVTGDYDRNFRLTESLKLRYFWDIIYPWLINALGREKVGLSYLEISELTGICQSKISSIIKTEKLEDLTKINVKSNGDFGNVNPYDGIGLPTTLKKTEGRPRKNRAIYGKSQKYIRCQSFEASFLRSIISMDDETVQGFSEMVMSSGHLSKIRPPSLLKAVLNNKPLVIATVKEFKNYLNNICEKLQGWRDGCDESEYESKTKHNLDVPIAKLTDLISQFDLTIEWLIHQEDGFTSNFDVRNGDEDFIIRVKVLIISLMYSCKPALEAFKPINDILENICPNGFYIERTLKITF